MNQHPVYSAHGNGESFFQAHAENLSALLECERETKKQTKAELLERLRTENLKVIQETSWMYEEKKEES